MRYYYKQEFKRSFLNINTIIAILIGIICMVIGTENNLFTNKFNLDAFYLFSYGYGSILGIIMPILVCIPFSMSYLKEEQEHFHENIFVRINKRKYIVSKIIINGLTGALTIGSILLISFILFLLVKGFNNTMDLINYFDLRGLSAKIYGFSPYLYIFYVILCASMGGFIFSTMALSISTIVKNRYISLLSPFIINIVSGIFLDQIHPLLYMINFINISFYCLNILYVVAYGVLVIGTFIGIYLFNSLRKDTGIEN